MVDSETFIAAHRVADLIFSYTSKEPTTPLTKPFLEDKRNYAPYSGGTQTESGLYLAYDSRRPNTLWTPWGEWGFGGDGVGNWETLMPEIHKRLGAIETEVERIQHGKLWGPIYGLTRIDETILPEPKLQSWVHRLPREKSYQQWCDLSRQFSQVHS